MHRLAKSVLIASALLAFAPGAALAQQPALAQTETAGPYQVTLHHSLVDLKSGLVVFAITKDGKPAADLLHYDAQGASGSADLVDNRTGATFHLTMNPAGTSVETSVPANPTVVPVHIDPEIEASLPVLQPGTYTMWVHIRGGDATIYTAQFTLPAR